MSDLEINIRLQLIKDIESLKAFDPKLEKQCDDLIKYNKYKILELQNSEKRICKKRKLNIN